MTLPKQRELPFNRTSNEETSFERVLRNPHTGEDAALLEHGFLLPGIDGFDRVVVQALRGGFIVENSWYPYPFRGEVQAGGKLRDEFQQALVSYYREVPPTHRDLHWLLNFMRPPFGRSLVEFLVEHIEGGRVTHHEAQGVIEFLHYASCDSLDILAPLLQAVLAGAYGPPVEGADYRPYLLDTFYRCKRWPREALFRELLSREDRLAVTALAYLTRLKVSVSDARIQQLFERYAGDKGTSHVVKLHRRAVAKGTIPFEP